MLKAYDLKFCSSFTGEQLRKIYAGERPEVLDELVKAVEVYKKENGLIVEKQTKQNKTDKKQTEV